MSVSFPSSYIPIVIPLAVAFHAAYQETERQGQERRKEKPKTEEEQKRDKCAEYEDTSQKWLYGIELLENKIKPTEAEIGREKETPPTPTEKLTGGKQRRIDRLYLELKEINEDIEYHKDMVVYWREYRKTLGCGNEIEYTMKELEILAPIGKRIAWARKRLGVAESAGNYFKGARSQRLSEDDACAVAMRAAMETMGKYCNPIKSGNSVMERGRKKKPIFDLGPSLCHDIIATIAGYIYNQYIPEEEFKYLHGTGMTLENTELSENKGRCIGIAGYVIVPAGNTKIETILDEMKRTIDSKKTEITKKFFAFSRQYTSGISINDIKITHISIIDYSVEGGIVGPKVFKYTEEEKKLAQTVSITFDIESSFQRGL